MTIRQVEKTALSVPLYIILVVPFVLQICLAVGLVSWLSLRQGQQAVDRLATQLKRSVGENMLSHLQTYLSTPHQINQINAAAIEQGILDIKNPATLERYFWQQLQDFPSVSYAYFGNSQGGYIGAGRQDDGSLTIEATEKFVFGDYYIYSTDTQGNRAELLKVSPNYDSRRRPWYTAPVADGEATWSEIYPFFAELTLGIAASQPVYDRKGNLLGVLATELVLSQLGDFLASLQIGNNGHLFIIEPSGEIVASSTREPPFILNPDRTGAKRLPAAKSTIPLIRKTWQYLTEYFSDLHKIDRTVQLKFKLDGQWQFLQVTPLSDDRGINWLIVIVVPERDFMEQINTNTRITIILCLIALLLSAIAGIMIYRWIAQPVMQLSKAVKSLAQQAQSGDLRTCCSLPEVEVRGVKEIAVLADSFTEMAAQLREYLTFLERTNEELEKRVYQRTAQLQQDMLDRTMAESDWLLEKTQLLEQAQLLEQRVEQRTAALISAKDAAEAANLAKSSFLAQLSHSLGTPINAILDFTAVTKNDVSLNPLQQENLEIISRSAEDLLALRDDIGQLEKFSTGRVTLEEHSFDLYELLSSLEQIFQPQAASKQLQLIFDRAASVPQYVRTDAGKLRQVLINLLENAIEFTVAGTVTLRVHRDSDNGHLLFAVADTGLGIAPDELETLFEPFKCTERWSMSSGTGFSLPITRQLVQMMGGDITVNSRSGMGTTFTFDIQVDVASASSVQTQMPKRRAIALEPAQPRYRILVVEDCWDDRKRLVKLLISLGFEVLEAANGEEAINVWSTGSPYLILMDMGMPVMDGYEATNHIRSKLKGQTTGIIAMTANALESDQVIAFPNTWDDFISKPFPEELLLDKIAQHLGVSYLYE
ncbi:MAG: ATP-binding protein [Hormoscilla sp.]